MSLTDIMSHTDLAVYPQLALVIFLTVFAVLSLRLFCTGSAEAHGQAAALPLDDGHRASTPAGNSPVRTLAPCPSHPSSVEQDSC